MEAGAVLVSSSKIALISEITAYYSYIPIEDITCWKVMLRTGANAGLFVIACSNY